MHRNMSDKTQEIKDAIAESIGDVVQSITTLMNNRTSHEDDNTGNDTDDNDTGDDTGKNKPNDDEIGKRAIDQYIKAQKDNQFTGKTI